MYCINCGVELADSEKKCPLCGTVVFHPELSRPNAEPSFPAQRRNIDYEVDRTGVLFILSILFALPIVITLLINWQISHQISWSGYVSGGLLLTYIIVILPMWFKHPNPVIFTPVDFAAIALYVLYIAYATGGHWYLRFALPVIAGAALIICSMVALLRYFRRAYLFIFGGAFILSGVYMMLIELLVNLTFHISNTFLWSFYPLAACFLFGMMLIIIALSPPLRDSLRKKFFI